MKKFTIFSMLCACLLISCTKGGQEKKIDSTATDSVEVTAPSGNHYTPVEFKSDAEVKAFLAFKKFSNSSGWIAFNRDGGMIDGEEFRLTKINITSPEKTELTIEIPKMNLTGLLILSQTEEGVEITDSKTEKKYKLND